jgi:hypothetical protein
MQPGFARQAKNMKYAALNPKNTMNRTTLAAETVVGIGCCPDLSLRAVLQPQRVKLFVANRQLASAIPDSGDTQHP